MLRKVLVLFFHPRFEDSIVNKSLVKEIQNLPGTTFHDVYERYPDFDIDIRFEQSLLLQHDIIVWHHPFYWYSCPPLMKQWIDLVLEYGWAYGKNGRQLQGKYVFNCLTAGGSQEVYREGGRNRFTVNEFLRPFEQTAYLCQMHYLPPFVVHHANLATRPECLRFATAYKELLSGLVDGSLDLTQIAPSEYLNAHLYPTL
ncbi:MAG: NAD(P)H-dependent oxidoreductase [Saprospiraceae bacterium]|nr:NAD(P)H-dependent oxidoreductase [Saprospiraceae bacterium]